MWQAAKNLFLLKTVGHRDLNRAVEGQFAAMHAGEHLERIVADILALDQFGTKGCSGGFDLSGEMNLLGTGQQRNLAHLREIHTDGIVGPVLGLLDQDFFSVCCGVTIGARVAVRLGRFVAVDDHARVDVVFRIVAFIGQVFDLAWRGDNVVFNFVQERVVQCKSPSKTGPDGGSGWSLRCQSCSGLVPAKIVREYFVGVFLLLDLSCG